MSEAPVPAAASAAPRPGRLDLGEILLQTSSLSGEQLEQARQKQAETGHRLAD
ncbi:MAG: hypothetical protein JRH16_15875, partial [Deltaproteobacteria bacterium]|nr:hypothetical protein [Deltaproteobacteria bacterium]